MADPGAVASDMSVRRPREHWRSPSGSLEAVMAATEEQLAGDGRCRTDVTARPGR